MTQPRFKFPPGLARDMRIVTTARYAAVYPQAPRHRAGKIVGATHDANMFTVLFDGLAYPLPVHRNCFEPQRSAAE